MELINAFSVSLQAVWNDSGFSAFTMGNGIMILVGLILLYLAIVKEFEPLLLGPIAFGCILANFPRTGFLEDPGLMLAIHYGIANEIFPPLIFLGIGAMTDFGPLIARRRRCSWAQPHRLAYSLLSSVRCSSASMYAKPAPSASSAVLTARRPST